MANEARAVPNRAIGQFEELGRGAFESVGCLKKNDRRGSNRVGAQLHWAIAVVEHTCPSRRETALLQEPVAAEEVQNQISQRPTLLNAPAE